MSLKFSTIPQKRLLQGISSSATSFYLDNILSFDGLTDVAPSDLGSVHYCAFRNDTGTVLELMEIDPATISSGPITINKRGLSFYGDLTTQDTDLKLDWPANTIVMLGTDVPQIFQWLKEYIDTASIAGAVPMTPSVSGIARLNKAADDPTTPYVVGANDIVSYAADSVGTDSYAITPSPAITAYATGQMFRFKAGTANTGACTLNANGLGAKTIKKNVSEDLATGDILASQIVTVIYDGTNMQLIATPPSSIPVVRTYLNAGSPATWAKPTGLKYVIVEVQGGGGGGGGVGSDDQSSFGGGGGGYSRKLIAVASLGATETVTTGAGGNGGSGNNVGSTGGTSSFGSHCQATGGTGGDDVSQSQIGVGGVGSGGDVNIEGGDGDTGVNGTGGSGTSAKGGMGGSSYLGGGGNGAIGGNTGGAGNVYGGGGGGTGRTTVGSSDGGAGAAGIVIVTEYY